MDDYPYDLGSYSRPVTTDSPAAQLWFDRGLAWLYGFNHEEAIACFGRALEHDPGCAMAHWGIAYAAGPNYNMPWAVFDAEGKARALARAFDAAERARDAADRATPPEAALIDALAARYPQRDPIEDQSTWDDAFADAMRATHAAHPADPEIAAIFADALMNRTPWKMWDLRRGTPAEGADTEEAMAVLETALARPGGMDHPGLTHLHVHLMEMSPHPERAYRSADRLRRMLPDAGHLVHMPTHIDMLCGQYHDVVHWNERAVEADLKYFAREGAMNIYTGYRQHDYHFVIYGALFLGRIEPALRAVRGMAETTPEELLRLDSPPMADYFESYLAMEPHVLIRFGRWDDILALPFPADPALYCTQEITLLYARGVALAALGRVPEAEKEEARFLDRLAAYPDTRLLHNNRVVDLMAIAREMLRGEILYRQGAHEAAFDRLRAAVAAEDALPYDEPWGWMQPSRHALGALLMEQGRIAEAEAVYRADLGLGEALPRAQVHPDNVWSLRGLHDCLTARTAPEAEIAPIRQKLEIALARADPGLAASCFCARAAGAAPCREPGPG
ncbi:MAG: tetratricopeptide repeat protein [Paracoccaceae bacterium]